MKAQRTPGESISSGGLTDLGVGFLLGSALLLMPGGGAKQDTWAAILMGAAEGAVVSLVYCGLAARFKATFPQICKRVYGKHLGTAAALSYIFFLFYLGSLVMGNVLDFTAVTLLPRTPTPVVAGVLVVVASCIAGHGLGAMARFARILVPIILASIGATLLLLIPDYRVSRLMPVLATPLPKLAYSAHIAASFPFNEAVAFMMVLPFVKGGRGSTAMLPSIAISGIAIAAGAARNTAVLGNLCSKMVYPSYSATRLIDIADFLTRLESLVAVNFLGTALVKIVVLLWGTAVGLQETFGLGSYRGVVVPLGIIMAALAAVNFENVAQNIYFADRSWPVFAPLFQIVLPGVTFLMALVRGVPRADGRDK